MKDSWTRTAYLQQQVLVLSVEASAFFTDKEYELMMGAGNKEYSNEERADYKKLLDEEISKNDKPRRLRYDKIYDKESLSLDERNKKYYIDENGETHYEIITPDYLEDDRALDIKHACISSEFISEFHRVLNVAPGSFFIKRIIVHWKNQDVAEQLLKYGIVIRLKENNNIYEEHFSLFTASAGQMRTSKFSLVADSLMPTINKRLFCGMTIDKINSKRHMLSSKLLAYRALGCSASERWYNPDGTKFSIRQCVVVPDFTYKLKDIVVDNISADKIERINVGSDEIMSFIEENANDGLGLILPGTFPHNIDTSITRSPFIKGLLTEFDYLGFCDYHSVEPIVTDYWGKKHNLREENIKVILTESMFKLAAYWDSWEDYCKDWEDGDCYMCFLQAAATKEEDTYSPLSYQMFQCLSFMTDDEMHELLEQPIHTIQGMPSNVEIMKRVLGADAKSDKARDRALAAYPELMKITEFKSDLYEAIRAKIDATRSSKFNLGESGKLNRRLFVVREPWALCRYWFLGDDSGTGFCEANQICCKPVANDYDKVALSRSPGLFLDAVIANVIRDDNTIPEKDNPYYWYRTNCVYLSCKDGTYLNINADWDGDMLNVILSTPYINALERTIKEFNTVTNYYPGLSGTKSEITIDTLAKSITVAAEGNIGTISNSLTKLWNSPELAREIKRKISGKKYNQSIIDDYMMAGKALLLKNQYTIDLAKTNYVPSLSDRLQSNIDKCIPNNRKMPMFFRFTSNFTNKEQNRDLNTEERINKCEEYSDSICDRICRYVDSKVLKSENKKNGIVCADNAIAVDFSYLRTYDYKIFYGNNCGVERNQKVIDEWKKWSQKFSFSRIQKENAKEAAAEETTINAIKTHKIILALKQTGLSDDVIYYTLVDYLFRDNAFEKACGSNKYFWNSYLGDMAAEIINYNVVHGLYDKSYDKNESDVDDLLDSSDKFSKKCSCCGKIFTPSSTRGRANTGNPDGLLYCPKCSTDKEKERKYDFDKKKSSEKEDSKSEIIEKIIDFVRENKYSEEDFIDFIRKNNEIYKNKTETNNEILGKIKIKRDDARYVSSVFGYEMAELSDDSIERRINGTRKLKNKI